MAEAVAFILLMAAVAFLLAWGRFWLAPKIIHWLYGVPRRKR